MILATAAIMVAFVAGCRSGTPTLASNVGTTATVGLPDGGPPILTQALADQLRPGMSQDEALAMLEAAARDTPSQSLIETAVRQGKLNTVRYDLTITQGSRKLVLAFRDNKLTDAR